MSEHNDKMEAIYLSTEEMDFLSKALSRERGFSLNKKDVKRSKVWSKNFKLMSNNLKKRRRDG